MSWGVVRLAAFVLVCVVSAAAGAYLLVRAFASTVEPFSLGTVGVRAVPALDGRVDVYVPIADWGVRGAPYGAPVAVEVRFRSLDRDEALDALRSGATARESLEALRSELAEIGRAAIRRSALLGLAGGVGGGMLGGAVVGAALRRRRWLAYGAAIGLLVPVAYVGTVLATLREVDYTAFEEPTFYAHGRELPRLLSFSEQLLTAGESYTESYERSLAGLANLVAFAGEGRGPGTSTASIVLASDLHANTLVLPVLEDYTSGKPVFLAGDFTLRGTRPESRLVPLIATLGESVVAVSGNHDSRPFMVDLARAGAIVLTRDGRLLPDGSTDGRPVVEIEGLEVAGYDDPLEGQTGHLEARPLDLTEPEFAEASRGSSRGSKRFPRARTSSSSTSTALPTLSSTLWPTRTGTLGPSSSRVTITSSTCTRRWAVSSSTVGRWGPAGRLPSACRRPASPRFISMTAPRLTPSI